MPVAEQPVLDHSLAERRESFQSEALVHFGEVHRVARTLARDASAAEDAAQETMLKAWRAWDRFRTGSNARAWLLTILRNTHYSDSSRERRRAQLVDDARAREDVPTFEQRRDMDPEGWCIVDEEVLAAIEELSHQHREALMLSDVHELTYAEIARITQAPVGTVKSRLFRARRVLRERLYEYAREMGYVKV